MVGVQWWVGRGSGGQGVCGMYGLGINGGVKGPLQEYLTPCKGGLSLPILDFDQLADI